MEITDVEQRLAFLDEAQRREHAAMERLRAQATTQAAELKAATEALAAVTADLKTAQARLARLETIDITLTQMRAEMAGLVEHQEAQAKTEISRLRDTDATGQAQVEALARLVQGLEERMTSTHAAGIELRERLARQDVVLSELNRSLQALRVDLTTTQGQLIKFPQIEQALEIAKAEIVHMVREYRAQSQADQERLVQERLEDRQLFTRGLAELDTRLGALPPIQERLKGHDAETARLNTTLNQLAALVATAQRDIVQRSEPIPALAATQTKHAQRIDRLEAAQPPHEQRMDGHEARLQFLDEMANRHALRIDVVEATLPPHAQRMDGHQAKLQFLDEMANRHAHRLDAVEARLPGYEQEDATLLEKIEFLEDWVQRTATRLDEVQRFEDDLRRTLTEAVEAEKVRDAQREQRLAAWAAELVEQRRMVEDWKKVMRGYEEHHQGVTRQMREVDELGRTIDQQQKASAEAQRIEAEKMRREVAEWQSDVDKRWSLFFKQRDWDWSEQRRTNEAHVERLRQLEAWRSDDVQSASDLADRLDGKDRELLMRIEDLWEIEETALKRRLADLKEWLNEVQDSQASSPKPRVPKPGEKILGTDERYRRP